MFNTLCENNSEKSHFTKLRAKRATVNYELVYQKLGWSKSEKFKNDLK